MNQSTTTANSLKEKKERKKKQQRLRLIILGVVLFISGTAYWLFAPLKGSYAFGICKTFLELQTRYPDTLRLSTVDDLGAAVKIWFVKTDSFGEYRLEPIQCTFRAATQKDLQKYGQIPFVLDKVEINRQIVDAKTVSNFNYVIPYLISNPPNLDLPYPLPDSLEGLQIDSARFRKPIL